MSLTHVCVWDGKAGYRRVSIEEACSMYPYTVAANRGIFVCSLCAQNVGLTAPGANVRHFRHTSAAQKKSVKIVHKHMYGPARDIIAIRCRFVLK